MMEKMMEEIVAQMRAVNDKPELFAEGAKMMRNAHNALLEQGFSEEQAVRIVAGQGVALKNG